jgi:hypothetical protein
MFEGKGEIWGKRESKLKTETIIILRMAVC